MKAPPTQRELNYINTAFDSFDKHSIECSPEDLLIINAQRNGSHYAPELLCSLKKTDYSEKHKNYLCTMLMMLENRSSQTTTMTVNDQLSFIMNNINSDNFKTVNRLLNFPWFTYDNLHYILEKYHASDDICRIANNTEKSKKLLYSHSIPNSTKISLFINICCPKIPAHSDIFWRTIQQYSEKDLNDLFIISDILKHQYNQANELAADELLSFIIINISANNFDSVKTLLNLQCFTYQNFHHIVETKAFYIAQDKTLQNIYPFLPATITKQTLSIVDKDALNDLIIRWNSDILSFPELDDLLTKNINSLESTIFLLRNYWCETPDKNIFLDKEDLKMVFDIETYATTSKRNLLCKNLTSLKFKTQQSRKLIQDCDSQIYSTYIIYIINLLKDSNCLETDEMIEKNMNLLESCVKEKKYLENPMDALIQNSPDLNQESSKSLVTTNHYPEKLATQGHKLEFFQPSKIIPTSQSCELRR